MSTGLAANVTPQLAAWFTAGVVREGTDLVVWVDAASQQPVIEGYAQAAARVGVPGTDGTDPAADAAAFVEWLHATDRRWLVVLDDVTDPAHLTGMWPPHRPVGCQNSALAC